MNSFIVFIIISIAISYIAYTYYKKSNVCDQNMVKKDKDYKMKLSEISDIITKKDEELKKIQANLGDANTTIDKKGEELKNLRLSLVDVGSFIEKKNEELTTAKDKLKEMQNKIADCDLKLSNSQDKFKSLSGVCNQIIIFDPKQEGYLHLAQIDVYDKNNNLIPISESYLKMDGELPAYPVKNLIDKNISTFAHSNGKKRSITITFPSTIGVSTIVLTNRQDCCKTRANGLMVRTLLYGTDTYLSYPVTDVSGSAVYENGGYDDLNNKNSNSYNYISFNIPDPKPSRSNDPPIITSSSDLLLGNR